MLKIKSIRFSNHPIFEDKEFDFSLYNERAAENIIVVGENGKGKTNFIKEIENLMLEINDYKLEKLYSLNEKFEFIDNLKMEIKFDSNDIFIPKLDLIDNNTSYFDDNDIYIIPDWKNKLKLNRYIPSDRGLIRRLLNSIYSRYNFMNIFDIKNYSKTTEKIRNNNSINRLIYSENRRNEYLKEKRIFFTNLKSYVYKMKEEKKDFININININKKNYSKRKIYDLEINDFSILNDLYLNIENIKTFNSMIFWHDNISYILEKIEFFINELIKNKKIIVVNEEKEKNEDCEMTDDQTDDKKVIEYLDITKIIDKNLFYDNSDIIENVHKWIKNKLNNVFDNVNLSNLNKNLYNLINKSLEPLLNGIKNFFNSKDNNIEISKINWDESDVEKVLFGKNNSEIAFHSLSSGEKLILSICMSILNKMNNWSKIKNENDENWKEYLNSHNILLFDEIESGLHPDWQSKILKLIKNTTQNVGQRFLTTHSPIVCYSIDPKTDIIINLNPKNNTYFRKDLITFKRYNSIQDCVNDSLNFDYKSLSDEHDVWVEGISDKLYFDIAKAQISELIPFNILANEHSEHLNGYIHWSGSDFIIKKILIDFLFSNTEKNRNKNLIAILDGDVFKNEYNTDFIINKFSEGSNKDDKIKWKEKIISNIQNFEKLNDDIKSYKQDEKSNIILLNIKNTNGSLFQIFVLKKDNIECLLESSDKKLQDLIDKYNNFKCEMNTEKCKNEKSEIKREIESIITENKNKLNVENIKNILLEINEKRKNKN